MDCARLPEIQNSNKKSYNRFYYRVNSLPWHYDILVPFVPLRFNYKTLALKQPYPPDDLLASSCKTRLFNPASPSGTIPKTTRSWG